MVGGKAVAPVYLFAGKEDFLIAQEVYRLKAAVLQDGPTDMNYHRFSAKDTDIHDILSIAQTLPLLSEKRLVLVDDIDTLKSKGQRALLDYLGDPSPSTCLILIAGQGKLRKGSTLFKEAEKRGYLRIFNRLSIGRLTGWIRKEVKEEGKDIAGEAITRLISITGNNLRYMSSELQKVIIYVGKRDRIEVADIERVGADVREDTVFDLTSSIGMKDLDAALRTINRLSSEPPLMVLGAISRKFRILWKTKIMLRSGKDSRYISQALGLFPSQVRDYIAHSKRFTEDNLTEIFRNLRRADMELKSSNLSKRLILERFIFDLCQGR